VLAACGASPSTGSQATAQPVEGAAATPAPAPTSPAAAATPEAAVTAAEVPTPTVDPALAPIATVEVSGPAAANAKQLRLSVWGDVQDADVYKHIAEAWHKQQDTYRVSLEQYPGGYYEKMQANFAGGTPADVLYMQGWLWQGYAESNVLAPLDDYISKDGLKDRFPDTENYKNTTAWHGKTYMTPTDVGSLVVMYNKDLFDKKGVPYPQKGWTWEDFQQIVQKLSYTEGDKRFYGWAQAGGWNGQYGRVMNFLRRNGHVEWDQVIEPKKAFWDHEDVISALQFLIYDAIKNQWSPSPDVIAGGGVGVDTGRVAMVQEGPWYIPRLYGDLASQKGGINFDVVEPPLGKAGKNFNFSHVHGHTIATASTQKDGAWELMKFIISDEGQRIIAEGGRMCGTPENIDKIWGPIASKTYNFKNIDAFSNGMREGATPVIFGKGSQMNAYGGGPINSLWDTLLGTLKPAKDAIAEAQPEIQRQLDDYWNFR
jgi:multiple sugar transport system substrate-binding protein